jgi:hypothetical protein
MTCLVTKVRKTGVQLAIMRKIIKKYYRKHQNMNVMSQNIFGRLLSLKSGMKKLIWICGLEVCLT